MVAQVLSHAWQIVTTGIPTSRRWSAGPTPESNNSCGDAMAPLLTMISLLSTVKRSPLLFHLHSNGAIAVEHYPASLHVGPDGQVEPVASQVEVSQRRADPHSVQRVACPRRYSG